MSELEKPVPAPKKSDKPWSYRPQKGDEATEKFLANLLEANGGNRNKVIEYCVKLAMGQPITVSSGDGQLKSENKKLKEVVANLNGTLAEEEVMLKELRLELAQLKTQHSSLNTSFSEPTRERLQKVIKSRKIKDEKEGIEYCILYTAKNDWL